MGVEPGKRLVSLDAFRGLTIVGMILVNTPGSWQYVYPPLRHAAWHGCTPTDLVFPFFLFIVGVAMWYSYKRFNHKPSREARLKILKRATLIFVIGLGLNAFPFYDQSLTDIRILGVLQRIALAFLFGALICLHAHRKSLPWISAVILLGYWGLLAMAGGDNPYSLEGNFATTFDVAVLGPSHVYGGFGIPFDPEGFISTIPAIATVIIGYLIGCYIDRTRLQKPAMSILFALGALGIGIGWLWGLVFPINKPLWTSSYVLYTAGIATTVLTLFLWLIDVKQWKKWAQPFVVFGSNPLFIYMLSIIFVKIMFRIRWISGEEAVNAYQYAYQEIFAPLAGLLNGSLLFALTYVAIHWLIAHMLYQRKIFIKV